MNNTIYDIPDYVPEVDAASLLAVGLPAAEAASPPVTVAPQPAARAPAALPLDPRQALETLPPALVAHIHDLIADARAQGYLQGRNEQIEAIQHFTPPDDFRATPVDLPRRCQCSIWDL